MIPGWMTESYLCLRITACDTVASVLGYIAAAYCVVLYTQLLPALILLTTHTPRLCCRLDMVYLLPYYTQVPVQRRYQ